MVASLNSRLESHKEEDGVAGETWCARPHTGVGQTRAVERRMVAFVNMVELRLRDALLQLLRDSIPTTSPPSSTSAYSSARRDHAHMYAPSGSLTLKPWFRIWGLGFRV